MFAVYGSRHEDIYLDVLRGLVKPLDASAVYLYLDRLLSGLGG